MLRPKTHEIIIYCRLAISFHERPDSDNADVGIRDIPYVYAIISAPLCALRYQTAHLFSPFSLLRNLNGRSLK